MKEAMIFFEGKEVTKVRFDKVLSYEDFWFFVSDEVVAEFPKGYAYCIISNDVFASKDI